MTRKHVTIVGGGFVGTLAALRASQFPGLNVTLVEKDHRLAGLYGTAWSEDGYHFDYGSRAILATGITEFDDLMFGLLPDARYRKSTTNLKEFSYQGGGMREYTNCLDARLLPEPVYQRARAEALAVDPREVEGKEFDTLAAFGLAHFGPTLVNELIRPAMKKITGLELEDIHPTGLQGRSLNRIIIADQAESKTIKAESAFNDARFAFAKYDDHASSQIKAYPLFDGLDDFGARLQAELELRDNVQVICGETVSALENDGGQITEVTLETGLCFETDMVIWSIAPFLLGRLRGLDLSGFRPPNQKDIYLAHLLFDGDVTTTSHFLYDFDPDHAMYRTTFYDNYCERPQGHRSITIEAFMGADQPHSDETYQRLFAELKDMGAVSKDSQIVKAHAQRIPRAAPSFAKTSKADLARLNAYVTNDLDNLKMLGRTSSAQVDGSFIRVLDGLISDLI